MKSIGKFLVTLRSMNKSKLIEPGRLHAHAQKRCTQCESEKHKYYNQKKSKNEKD
jgi:hypothetical protein